MEMTENYMKKRFEVVKYPFSEDRWLLVDYVMNMTMPLITLSARIIARQMITI